MHRLNRSHPGGTGPQHAAHNLEHRRGQPPRASRDSTAAECCSPVNRGMQRRAATRIWAAQNIKRWHQLQVTARIGKPSIPRGWEQVRLTKRRAPHTHCEQNTNTVGKDAGDPRTSRTASSNCSCTT